MITRLYVTGNLSARVIQELEEDPTMGSYSHLIEVVGTTGHQTVRVGAPLAAQLPLTHVEITSVVQLLVGRLVTVAELPKDEVDQVDRPMFVRWRTYDVTG
jgi:hypothetical protein